MTGATNIYQILEQLDEIVKESIATNSNLGLFAYIYRRTTAEIASEIALGHFKDNNRLEAMDVAFANLYLDAYKAYHNKEKVSAVWAYAFDHATDSLSILQHIMLGMNAHINLDLGIATAKTMSGQQILDIEDDFKKVNDILFQITNELQDRLSRVSPFMFILDWIGKHKDEMFIGFSMSKARQQSWNSANLLWSLGDVHDKKVIHNLDQFVLKLSERIRTPKSRSVRVLFKLLKLFVTQKVSTIISKLKAA